MGRELKRVALDFKWSIGQLWKGYINPYRSVECKSCGQSGLNPSTKKLSDDWYSHLRTDGKQGWSNELTDIEVEALAKSGRLSGLIPNRPYFDEDDNKWMAWVDGTKTEVEKPEYPSAEKVNEFFKNGFGHDAINHWVCTKARAKHLGIYGHCEYCEDGQIWQSNEIKKLNEDWSSFEPPTGEGFQLWNTATEGHPMSPVFKTLKELCDYLEKEKVSVFGHQTWTKEELYKSLSDGQVYYTEGNAVFI